MPTFDTRRSLSLYKIESTKTLGTNPQNPNRIATNPPSPLTVFYHPIVAKAQNTVDVTMTDSHPNSL